MIATKLGQNGAVLGQVPQFWPAISLKNKEGGAKKGGKPSSTKSGLPPHPVVHQIRFCMTLELQFLE